MKLSQINEKILSDDQCETIVFHGIEYTGEPAETAVVLGTNTHAESRAVGASKYYLDGNVKKLITSGHPAWDFPEGKYSEADYMKLIMVREGVPADAVIPENQAMTTLENMTYSLEILKNDPELLKGNKIILISSGYHMFRSILLAESVFKGIKIIPGPVWEPNLRQDTWRDSELGKSRIRNEVHYLIEHAVRGWIEDVDITGLEQ